MVRDPAVHTEVVEKITGFVQTIGFSVKGLTFSPVKGPEGNIEYLLYVKKEAQPDSVPVDAKALVAQSHQALGGEKA